jgi:IPT/TIG domain
MGCQFTNLGLSTGPRGEWSWTSRLRDSLRWLLLSAALTVCLLGCASAGTSTSTSTMASPSITSLSPSSGAVGTLVTITGTNFGATQGTSTITFNGTVATPTSWSATSIVAPVPAGATTGNVVVTVGGQASNGSSFTVTTALPAEPTLIQHVSSSNTRNNGFASPFCYYFQLPNPTTSGNAVIVGFTFNSNPTPTVTDDKGDSYTMVENYYDTADTQSLAIAAAFNVSSGARNISVCFNSNPGGYVQPMATEFNNVIAVDGSGTGSNGAGTSVIAGNLTPGVSGDLAYQVAFSISVNQSSFTAGSQQNITWNLLSADLRDGWAGQYGVYDSTSAINPTMSMGTSQKWVSAAILLKTGASGSVPSGMRIVHLQHESICGVATCGSSFPNPLPLQFPSTGNLIVALSGGGNPVCTMSNLTDSDSNAWALAGSTYSYSGGGDDTAQVYYAGNAITSTSLSLTVNFSASTCDWSILFYDVTGAAASPLDTTNGATGDQTSTTGTLTVPYTITPAQSGELIFTNIIWDYNTATGLSSNVGTSYSDANMFSGELISGPEPVDQNNGWGHAVSTSTSAITFTWAQANDTSLAAGPYASMAAAFKAADPPEN